MLPWQQGTRFNRQCLWLRSAADATRAEPPTASQPSAPWTVASRTKRIPPNCLLRLRTRHVTCPSTCQRLGWTHAGAGRPFQPRRLPTQCGCEDSSHVSPWESTGHHAGLQTLVKRPPSQRWQYDFCPHDALAVPHTDREGNGAHTDWRRGPGPHSPRCRTRRQHGHRPPRAPHSGLPARQSLASGRTV